MIIKKRKEDILTYLEDTSNIKGNASSLYIPQDTEELKELIKEQSYKNIPVTLQGARTGTTGGCVPLEGTVISTEKLNKIIDIDPKRKEATVETGVVLKNLESEANKMGLTLKAYPTESLAFVGGTISTCASGPKGFKYGSIRNYISKLDVILSDGSLLSIKRGKIFSEGRKFSFVLGKKKFSFTLPGYNMPLVKTQAGYFIKDNMDFIDLFIGGEGTLGTVSKANILLQEMPHEIFDMVIFFKKENDALKFTEKVKTLKQNRKLNPSSLEFFDSNSLNFLKCYYSHIPPSCCAVYFEQETEKHKKNDVLNQWASIIESYGASLDKTWFADTPKERNKIYEFRHKLPEIINEFLRAHGQIKLSTDIAVKPGNFREMYSFYKETAKITDVDYVNFGHIGDNHLHFNFLPLNQKEYKRGKKAIIKFAKKAVSLRGTISAEHGIGKIKKGLLKIMYGRKHIREMASLKEYFDSRVILGRDNIFEKEILGKT